MTWDERLAAAWASLDDHTATDFRTLIDGLVAELPEGSAIADFERACAFDSTGDSAGAVPLYRRALETGLTGIRRRRAVIQLSSSLRNIGEQQESIRLLTAELAEPSDELEDAVKAVLALALTDVGRAREGVSLAVGALAPHLPRYQRSMANYARLLVADE
ncbi:MAG: tetratricopeptide repeat protein [Kibdelosporangium sp.]